MRKRPIRFELCFNENEFAILNELSQKMKTSKSQVLRFLLNSSVLVEAPSIDYRKWIRELRMIGNNINQVLVIARANGVFNSLELQKHLDELIEIEDAMRAEINHLKDLRRWQ